jgi:hypothetical protein
MTSCGRCQTPVEQGDLRCAICSLPTSHTHAVHETQAEVLRCDECGAAVSYDVNVRAPRCAFCSSVMHLERSEDPIEEAEHYAPFEVDPGTAQEALRRWLSTRGFFRPNDLATASSIDALRPVFWVAWVFECESLVSWAADSDAGRGRSAWAPHSGQSPLSLKDVLVSASRGLSYDEAMALTPHYDLSRAVRTPPQMEGAIFERFDVQRSAARQILARAVESTAREHARAWIPGSVYRNLHVSVLLRRLKTHRVALPSYVLAYRYAGELYRVVIHGQDPRRVIGDSPISKLKVAAVVGGVLLLLLLVALVVVIAGAR